MNQSPCEDGLLTAITLNYSVSNRLLLFNVAQDPAEGTDLYATETALAKQLDAALERYLKSVGAEKAEDSNSWKKGRFGETKTLFLERYLD
jgi:hypothetical protein